MRLKEEGFKDLVREWWQGSVFRGSRIYCLSEKLKALKGNLRGWNKDVFNRVEENMKVALKKVAYRDDLENQRPLSSNEMEERVSAIEDFKKWAIMEETSWRQKSRETWLKEGDKNTCFFHRMANSHSRRNNFTKIRIGGECFTSQADIRSSVVNAYWELLSNLGVWRANLEGLNFNRLEEGEVANLEVPFT